MKLARLRIFNFQSFGNVPTDVSFGTLLKGQGRGGTVQRAQGAHGSTTSPKTEKPIAKTAAQVKAAPEPAKDQNFSSFIWSVADLLRGDYMRSDYGKVILPFTVLRRLDCVLKASKPAGGN